jgi:hypothetical protein
MAEPSATGFLDLSTELRLEVYKHLIIDQLGNGHASGLADLFISCRTVYQELEKEYIVNARDLLNAQQVWKKTCQETAHLDFEPIRMRISSEDLLCRATNRELSIFLPISTIWEHTQRTSNNHRVVMYQLVYSPVFMPLLWCLIPVFRLPWSVLHIDVCNVAKKFDKNWNWASEAKKGFFEALPNLEEDRSTLFTRTDRLILDYGYATAECRYEIEEGMLDGFKRDIHNEEVPLIMTRPERMWIVRIQDEKESERGWKVVYDSRDGLPAPEGAVQEMKFEYEKWKARKYPDGAWRDKFEESELENWDFD